MEEDDTDGGVETETEMEVVDVELEEASMATRR